jgi:protein phosphatase
MGVGEVVEIDTAGEHEVEVGDMYILCSDGLSGQVADEEIGLWASSLPPREATAALVGLALVRGAPDNVTVIVARASEKEASKISAQDEPWPLSETSPAANTPAAVPWRLLAIAAGCLLGALVLLPKQGLMAADRFLGQLLAQALGDPGRWAVGWVLSAALALASIVAVVAAIIQCLDSTPQVGRQLLPGDRLGKGPYRSYACGPTHDLVEGIIASVESAADGLHDEERQAARAKAAEARQASVGGDFPAAISAAAEAIGAYARSVEAARSR